MRLAFVGVRVGGDVVALRGELQHGRSAPPTHEGRSAAAAPTQTRPSALARALPWAASQAIPPPTAARR
eukprot:5305641-Prymnesium_polylepis.1